MEKVRSDQVRRETLKRLGTTEIAVLKNEIRSLKKALAGYESPEDIFGRSKNSLQVLVDNIGKSVFVISPTLRVLSMNRQGRKWFPGVDPAKKPLCYQSFNYPPGDAPCENCPTRKTLEDGKTHQALIDAPSRTGLRHCRITSVPVKDRKGRILAAIEAVDDITEKIKLEKLVKKDRATFLTILQKAPYGIALIGEDGTYLFVNKEFKNLTGYSLTDIPTGMKWLRKAYPDPAYRKQVISTWRSDLANKPASRIFSITCKNGRMKDIEFKPTLLRNGQCILMLSDVTQRRAAEEALRHAHELLEKRVTERTAELRKANKELEREVQRRKGVEKNLREREEWLKAIIEAFDGLIYISSHDYRVEFMNERLIKRTGRDVKGERCYEVIHNQPAVCPWCVHESVFKGETIKLEINIPEEGRWYYTVNTPIHHVDGSISKHSIMFDITRRKEREAEIRKLNDELQQKIREAREANEELKTFSYVLSHDLKSPIIAVEGLSRRLVENQDGKMDEKILRNLRALHRSGVQMRELIEGLLSFFSIGQKELKHLPVDMASLVTEVFEQLKVVHEGKGIVLNIEPLPTASGDRVMVRQVLANILGNAIKYSRPEKPVVIQVGGMEGSNGNTYFVRDNGIGFSMDKSEEIFHAFKRLHPSEEYEGIGMGLAIVKRIIGRHGGIVRAESKPEEGTTVYFTLPAKK